jgi:hypothetical protein
MVLGGTMSYVAEWLKDREIVASDQFENLLEAGAFVVQHVEERRIRLGTTAVRVHDEHAICFQIG